MLDPAGIPERKSFPPRLLIMALGTFLAFSVCVLWVLGSAQWREDSQDPRKLFAQEVVATLRAHAPWAAQNGNGSGSGVQQIWSKLSRRGSSTQPPNG